MLENNHNLEELLSKIKILEAENDDLSNRAEETLLTSLVAETLNNFEIQDLILENILERISILKNIPICLCYSIKENLVSPISSFYSIEIPDNYVKEFSVSQKVLEELLDRPLILTAGEIEFKNLFNQFENKMIMPVSIGIFSFSSRTIENGIFVFIDTNDEIRIHTMSLLLQNIIDMTSNRLDNISLIKELEMLNIELSDRVILRTSELKDANEKLKQEIFEKRKTERELIIAKEKAEKANELKSQFLAQMSHEIRTPINTILNFSSLIQMDVEHRLSPDIKSGFHSIENAANRLLRTINLILNMSEVELGIYDPEYHELFILRDVLQPLIQEFKHHAERKNLYLNILNDTEDKMLSVDRHTISQIFVNLIDNAIKYTDSGGVTVSVVCQSEKIIVQVIDTGIGIEEVYIPHLFDKFSQEDQGYSRLFEGNGLGLALVKEYCKMNNAIINVQSKKNEGSKFTVEFS